MPQKIVAAHEDLSVWLHHACKIGLDLCISRLGDGNDRAVEQLSFKPPHGDNIRGVHQITPVDGVKRRRQALCGFPKGRAAGNDAIGADEFGMLAVALYVEQGMGGDINRLPAAAHRDALLLRAVEQQVFHELHGFLIEIESAAVGVAADVHIGMVLMDKPGFAADHAEGHGKQSLCAVGAVVFTEHIIAADLCGIVRERQRVVFFVQDRAFYAFLMVIRGRYTETVTLTYQSGALGGRSGHYGGTNRPYLRPQ